MSDSVTLAYRVDALVSRFLALQSEMMRLPWWRHWPIPGVFAAIDFPKHQQHLSLLARVTWQRTRWWN